jgi:hypothetical protein
VKDTNMASTEAQAKPQFDLEAAMERAGEKGYVYITPEEGRQMFEVLAQEQMGMSGEEFIRRWEAGEYDEIADKAGHRHIMELALMIPLARQES